MDAATEASPPTTREEYTSRPGALVWFFKKSRNRWKQKYQALRTTIKPLQNQLAAVTRSRQQWRTKAELASRRITALEAELSEARGRAAAGPQKRTKDRDRVH
jgi:predicted  nucleic acid-binding Zn-ribbon protein